MQVLEWQVMKFVTPLGSGELLWAVEVFLGRVQRWQWDPVNIQVSPWPFHRFVAQQLLCLSHPRGMFDGCGTAGKALFHCHCVFFCFLITTVKITQLLVIIIWVTQQSDTTKQWKRKMTFKYQCFGREDTDWREKTRGWVLCGLQQKSEEISKMSKDIRKSVGAASEDQDLCTHLYCPFAQHLCCPITLSSFSLFISNWLEKMNISLYQRILGAKGLLLL